MMRSILLIFLFLLQVSVANTYYVAKSGSNTNSGYSGSPWKTIQYAHDNMASGDSVIVQNGSYYERVEITTDGLTFVAESKDTRSVGGFWINLSDNIVIDGFHIKNKTITSGGDTDAREIGTGIYIKGENCIVNNCVIDTTSLMGIYMSSSCVDCQITNNVLSYNGMCGIYVKGDGHYVYNNTLSKAMQHPPTWINQPSGMDADGFRVFGNGHLIKNNTVYSALHSEPYNSDPHIDGCQTWGPLTNTVFDGNFFHNPLENTHDAQGFIVERSDGPVHDLTFINNVIIAHEALMNINNKGNQGDIPRMKIYNNVFYGTSNIAIRLLGAPDSEIFNNLFYDCHAYLSWKDAVGGSNTAYRPESDYNAHYASSGSPNYSSVPPPNIWDKNPLCVDVSAFNFRLRSASPLINAGMMIESVPIDFDGVSRPIGTSYDMGAFEFDPLTDINEEANRPLEYMLMQNYPNPFNPSTIISYHLPTAANVTLTIFNLQGQLVWQHKIRYVIPGQHEIIVDLNSQSSGVYFYRLEAGSYIKTKKMVLLK